MTALLDVEHLAAGHGALQVLFDVTLRVEPGEIVTVVGGNGAGKSTMLASLSGLLRPIWGGSVRFDGTDIATMPAWDVCRLGLVHVLERRRLAPYMSVIDNLKLSESTVSRAERPAWKRRLKALVDEHPLVISHGSQHAVELSGGQQQLIAVLRGTLAAPRLLLLDEPYQGLDLRAAEALSDLLLAERDRGAAIVLTEHRAEIIEGLGSRSVRLERGAILPGATATASAAPTAAGDALPSAVR